MINNRVRLSSLISLSLFYSSIAVVFAAGILILINAVLSADSVSYRFVMLPDSAMALLAASTMLIGAKTAKRYWVATGLIILLIVAVAGLIWNVPQAINTSTGFLNGRYRLPRWQSIMLLTFSLPWLLWMFRKNTTGFRPLYWLSLLVGLIVIVCCVVVLLLPKALTSTTIANTSLSQSAYMAMYLMLLGIASICISDLKSRSIVHYMPVRVWWLVSGVAFVSALLWFNFSHQLQSQVQHSADQMAAELQHKVTQMINEQRGLMYRLAERAAATETDAANVHFDNEFASYLRDFNYMDYLAALGSEYQLLYAKAQNDADLSWFNHYAQGPVNGENWRQSSRIFNPVIRMHYDHQSDHAFIIVDVPQHHRSEVKQLIASVDSARALTSLLPHIAPAGYFVKLAQPEQQQILYDSATNEPFITEAGKYQINLMSELNWQLSVFTNLQTLSKSSQVTANLSLITGWLATLLVLLSQLLYQQSQRHRTRLTVTNDKLRCNIAKLVNAEQELRLFKRAVDATSSGIVISDLRKTGQPVVYVNPAFEKLTGYSANDIIGKNCRILQGGEPDYTAKTIIRRAIAERQECSVVLKNFRKDNSLFWNKLFLAPVPDENDLISHYIGVQTDITAHKRFEQELAYNTSHDLLTGLPNRALLKDRLNQNYQQVLRRQHKISVLFIDLDGFKLINDSLGHLAGDEVLKLMAQRIKSCIRPGDTLARMGGDQFVLLLTELNDIPEIESVAQRILEAVAAPLPLGEQELHLSASIGLSIPEADLAEPMHLVQQADLAMYRAKQQGRNNYQWYSKELENPSGKQLNLRAQLRKAIANNEFELYYQPQIDAVSGDVVGLEALLRWPHPELGFISPDEFIPLAENIGEIVPLSNWVLQHAAAYNQSLIERGIVSVVMAVNVSSIQFARENFVDHLKNAIENIGLDSRWLEIELTESLLFENTEQVIFKLQQLRELGVKISIDDFGTGYSSLSYLKRLPIDKLKIDRSFIRDIVSDSRDAAISKAIIGLAHHLDIKVIAEGVENEAQAALLRKNLCDEYQGFYFGKPMPAAKLEHYLQNYQQHRMIKPEVIDGTKTILLVDDEENILSALTRSLRREGYRILSCTSAIKAFEVLALNQVQVIVSDQRMPGMSGTEFLCQVKDMYPDTIRMVLSGYTDLKSVTEAINKGAIYKFMTKPWQDEELRQEIRKAFFKYYQQQSVKTG